LPTGADAYLAFGYESSFGTEASTKDKSFGVGQRLTGVTLRNTLRRIYDLGSREAKQLRALRFEGVWSIEAILANNDWMKAVFGSETFTDNSSASPPNYQYDYDVADSVQSISIEYGFSGTSNVVRKLLGCVVTRCRLTTRVNDVVTLALDGLYKTEEKGTSLGTGVTESKSPITFAEGTLELPSGTTLAEVQTIDLTLTTNAELIFDVGSRYAVKAIGRAFDIDIRITAISEDSELLERAYGADGATSPQDTISSLDVKLKFDTGGTSTDDRVWTLDISNAKVQEITQAITPNDMILWDVTLYGKEITGQYIIYL